MIDKKRLTILIRNNCRIYGYDNGIIPIDPIQLYYNSHFKKYLYVYSGIHTFTLNTLFETQQELETYQDICRIIKTQELVIPPYKEFVKKEKAIGFKNDGLHYRCGTDGKYITIIEMFGSTGKTIYKQPLTEDSYIQACRICKNKFLN